MVLLLALLLSAPPASCEQLWPAVWKALDAQDLKGKLPFPTLPDGKERLGRAWVFECARFALVHQTGKVCFPAAFRNVFSLERPKDGKRLAVAP